MPLGSVRRAGNFTAAADAIAFDAATMLIAFGELIIIARGCRHAIDDAMPDCPQAHERGHLARGPFRRAAAPIRDMTRRRAAAPRPLWRYRAEPARDSAPIRRLSIANERGARHLSANEKFMRSSSRFIR